jgi:hypothetical protein
MQKTTGTHKEKSSNVHRQLVDHLEMIDFNGVGISKLLVMRLLADKIMSVYGMKKLDEDDYKAKFQRSVSTTH